MNILTVTPAKRNSLIAIIIAAAVLRFGAVLLFHPPLVSDDKDYDAIAHSVIHGEGFSIDGKLTAYRLPGYPLLVAGTYATFGDSKTPIRFFQVFSDLISCLLLFAIAKKIFSEKIALISAAIFAFFPIQVLYVSHVMTETVFTTVFLSIIWFMLERKNEENEIGNNALLGLLIGVGILIRSTIGLMPLVIFLYRWKQGYSFKANFRSMVIVGVTACLVVSPWIARNYIQFHRASLTSNVGVNFWIGNHPGAGGSYSFPRENNPLIAVEDDFERSDLGVKLGIQFITTHPLEYCLVLGKKFVRFFSPDYWLLMTMQYRPEWASAPNAATVFSQLSRLNVVVLHLPYILVLLMGTFGLVCTAPEDESKFFLLRTLFIYWLLAHLAFFADARYRFPIMPVLFLSAAYCWDIVQKNSFQRSPRRLAIAGILFVLFIGGWIGEYVIIHSKMIPPPSPTHTHVVKKDKLPSVAAFQP